MADYLSNLGRVRAAVRGARDGIARERLSRSQRTRNETEVDTWTRSRAPWRAAEPSNALTWGVPLSGQRFVEKLETYGAFGADKSLLEIGPGYGRLLSACLARRVPFASYTGIDLSAANIGHLSERFPDPRIRFVNADIESFDLPERYDSMMSSLTFKHLYPSFEAGLANVSKYMAEGGVVFFDLIESAMVDRLLSLDAYFREQTTFIRRYARQEIQDIVNRCGMQLVSFDEVQHAKDHRRLLVVATRS